MQIINTYGAWVGLLVDHEAWRQIRIRASWRRQKTDFGTYTQGVIGVHELLRLVAITWPIDHMRLGDIQKVISTLKYLLWS
jgi:hypothetical protein